mgnify:CR=1 FL=1
MESVFDELKVNEKKRQSVLIKLKKQKTPDEKKEEDQQKKDWEKKLLDLYGRDNKSSNDDTNDTKNGEDKK